MEGQGWEEDILQWAVLKNKDPVFLFLYINLALALTILLRKKSDKSFFLDRQHYSWNILKFANSLK